MTLNHVMTLLVTPRLHLPCSAVGFLNLSSNAYFPNYRMQPTKSEPDMGTLPPVMGEVIGQNLTMALDKGTGQDRPYGL